jgi:hypothetical protein
VLGIEIQEGYHANTKLDGLRVAAAVTWPGAIHEGKGHIQPIVDERATAAQREALLRIMSGQDTEPGATFFQVFAATYEKVYDPVFAKIDFASDVDGRTGHIKEPGFIDARGEPIRNPVTGDPHRVQIALPQGFEYAIAEVGRGWATTSGPVQIKLDDSHAHFANLHMTERGLVR